MRETDEIDRRAAEWVSRQDAGLDAGEERDLADWLIRDPRNSEAFSRLSRVAAVFDRARDQGAAVAVIARLQGRAGRRHRRRSAVAATAGLLAAAAVLIFYSARPPRHGSVASAPPSAAEPGGLQVRALPDGSLVELRAGAEIAIQYEPAFRRLRLLHGEAHFQVAKNPARPFLVEAGTVEVRAVGTAFDVNLQSQSVGVIVTEGKVSLDRTGPAAGPSSSLPPTFVRAGDGVVVSTALRSALGAAVTPMTAQEKEAGLRWRAVTLNFAGTELEQAVAQMNRYNRLQIAIGDGNAARLRVSGAFHADNPEGFVRIVQASFDLQADRRGDSVIVLTTAP